MAATAPRLQIQTLCPACNSNVARHWCYASDLLLGSVHHTFEYLRCERCSTVFLRDRVDESLLERIYPPVYPPYAGPSPSPAARGGYGFLRRMADAVRLALEATSPENILRKRFNTRLDGWLPARTAKGLALDFGCGAGRYLDELSRMGFDTIGMDFSTHALAAIRARGHVALEITDAGWKSIADRSVDFVRMNHVVEHLYHPREVLTRLKAKLRNGGRLHLALPNPSGVSAAMFRQYWHGLDCPRHVALYPPNVVTKLLRESGFGVLDVIQEPMTKDHIRSWAYLAAVKGLLTKGNPDQYMGWPLLRMLAALPMTMGLLLGRSDRFHVVAEG